MCVFTNNNLPTAISLSEHVTIKLTSCCLVSAKQGKRASARTLMSIMVVRQAAAAAKRWLCGIHPFGGIWSIPVVVHAHTHKRGTDNPDTIRACKQPTLTNLSRTVCVYSTVRNGSERCTHLGENLLPLSNHQITSHQITSISPHHMIVVVFWAKRSVSAIINQTYTHIWNCSTYPYPQTHREWATTTTTRNGWRVCCGLIARVKSMMPMPLACHVNIRQTCAEQVYISFCLTFCECACVKLRLTTSHIFTQTQILSKSNKRTRGLGAPHEIRWGLQMRPCSMCARSIFAYTVAHERGPASHKIEIYII